eukprot:Em0006g890a
MFKCLQEWIAASGAVNCPCCSEDGPLVSSHVRRAPDCSRDIKAGDYEGHDCVPSLTPEEEKQAKIRGIVSGGEASALIQKEVLILSEEERRSLLDKAGISSSIELGAAQLKSSGICLAGEERMRHISSQIVGDNLKGEIAPFSFPIPSGGEEIKGAPLVYIPQLVDKVVQLLEGNERTGRLTWHEGFIPANEIWLKIGGDKGGGTFKMTFQILFVAGDSITNLHVAPDRFKDQVEHLHGMKWRQYTVKVFICGLRVPVKDVWLVRSQCDQMATPLIVRGHAKERSLEDTCADHQCYVSSGSVKKDAQMFFNCISEPIFDIPVSQVCPPGLHIMLGIFTKMFHLLEALCCQLDLELTSQTTPPVFPSTARCCKGFHCSKQTLKLPSMHMKCCSSTMGKLFKLFIHIAFFVQLLLLLEERNILRAPPTCNLNLLSMLSYPSAKLTVDCSDGPDLIPAGYLAIEMINNRSDILEDYHLELIDGHAGCGNPALSIWEGVLVKEIFDSGKKVAGIVGLSCYDLAEKVGSITAIEGIALANAHISSSFILGNATLYPYSVGITPSMLRFVDAFAALMKNSSWKHIGFVFEDSIMHLTVFRSLFFKVGEMNGHEIAFSSIVTENYIPLDSIKRSSARVVLAFIGSSLAQKVMCLAHYKDMFFPKYQWIFFYRKLDEFQEVDVKYEAMSFKCSEQQMLLTLNRSLSIDFSYEPAEPNLMLFSGVTYREFTQQYSNAVRRYNSGEYGKPVRMATTSLRGNLFHDAVWVLALALNATDAWMKTENKSLCDYGYGQPNVTRKIRDEMCNVGFLGASGWNNCTPGTVIVSQFSSNGTEKIAIYHDDNHLQLLSTNAVLLANPVQKCQVPLPMFITILIVLFIAFILIVLINTLNVVFREHSSVKASSHRLNHLGYVGCYLILIGIAILNITERFFFSLAWKIYLCNSIPWLGSVGFTLTYGTVIVKLYRLYQTFVVTSRNLQRPQSGYVLMKDSSLAVVIVAMTVPVIIICAATLLIAIPCCTSAAITAWRQSKHPVIEGAIHIDIVTNSQTELPFNLSVSLSDMMQYKYAGVIMGFGGSYRASVGPGYPQIHATIIDREAPYRFQTHCLVFYFEFPGNTIGIRLGLESESETSYLCRTPLVCGVKHWNCLMNDLLSDAMSKGLHQIMSTDAVLTITRDELEDASFFLVLIGANSSLCHTQKSDIETWAASAKLTVDCSDGPDLIPAGYLAIEMINNRSDILEDYHLELIDGHAGCGNPALSIWEGLLVKEIFDSGKKVAGIVGLSCYDLAEKVGLITAKKGIALVNAHISSSFILGDAILYPYSVGITPSMLRFVDAFAALMKNSSWKHIGFVFEDSVMHLTVFQSLFFKVGQMNGHKIAFSSIVTENYIPLDSIKRSSARVVLAFIGSSLAQKLMCLAHYKDMLFPKYQWIFLYRKLDEFREVDFKYEAMSYKCSEQQMLLTLNCSLSIDFSSEPVEPNRMLFSGVTYREFTQQYSNAVRRYNSGEYGKPVRMATTSLRGNLFHDAVWVLALALNATDAWMKTQNKSLCDYGYGQPNVTRKICDEMIYIYRDIGFLGASGWNNCTPGMVILSQFSSNGVEKIATYHDDNHLQLLSKNAVLLANPVQKCQSSTEGSWSLNYSDLESATNGLVTLLSATAIPNTTSLRSTVQFRGTYRQRSRPCHSTPWEKYKRSYLQGFETRVFPLQECRHCLKFGFQLEKLLRIRDILVETCRRAHIGDKVEVGNNLSRDHSKTRPADILLPNWFLGRTAALDVSITSPLNPVTLLEAGVSATAAAQATEARKHQANDPKCSELASRLATSTCRPKSTILHEIYGRLNLNLVCANATAILSRIAPPP